MCASTELPVTMIDHVLGRPSVQFRKIQVLAVVSFWSFYLYRCAAVNSITHSPPCNLDSFGS